MTFQAQYSGVPMLDNSTLIYTLNENSDLAFSDFALIIKSLHSYKVNNIEESPDYNQVIVKLQYNASMKNVRHRLGNVPATVRKCNPFIKPTELSAVESLRTRFGFGAALEEEEPETPEPAKKRRYKKMPKADV